VIFTFTGNSGKILSKGGVKMERYRKAYFYLFCQLTELIEMLQAWQQEAEAIILGDEEE
jgi:hypothetical protein